MILPIYADEQVFPIPLVNDRLLHFFGSKQSALVLCDLFHLIFISQEYKRSLKAHQLKAASQFICNKSVIFHTTAINIVQIKPYHKTPIEECMKTGFRRIVVKIVGIISVFFDVSFQVVFP